MNKLELAYLAGAIDSDGYISIKRSTYHLRVRGDAVNALYHEIVGLKQVTPHIPDLLKTTFGGSLGIDKPSTVNGKALYRWHVTDKSATDAIVALLPYLRVKKRQADLVIELRESKGGHYWQAAHWFAIEYPNWREMEMLTTDEANTLLRYKHPNNLSQAVRNGTLLALPYNHAGRWEGQQPRYPRVLVERVASQRGRGGRANVQAPELIAWKERLYTEVKGLNRIGIGEHPISMRTGPYTPLA